MELQEKYKYLFKCYQVDSILRVAHFMAQIQHESGLKPIAENLNYSGQGLLRTFSKYFPTFDLQVKYQRQPEKIANRVYANRMGNGDEQSGDGWDFRGRGFLQITGKDNYLMLSKDTKIDCYNNPDLLLVEANAMISALWFWQKNKLNEIADKNDIVAITKKINGGTNGLEHRKNLLAKYMK